MSNRYVYRGYCDACNEGGPWLASVQEAKSWRERHFERTHPDNPMVKENCRIQREWEDE